LGLIHYRSGGGPIYPNPSANFGSRNREDNMNHVPKRLIGLIAAFSLLLTIFSGIVTFASSGTVNADKVNFRTKPSTSATIIKKVSKGTKVTLISKTGNWYKAKIGTKTGYINAKYVKKTVVKLKTAKLIAGVANIRKSASTTSKILGKLKKGNTVTILSSKSDWYRIKTVKKTVGYVKKAFLKINTTTSRGSERTTKGEKIVAYAKTFLGTKYVYGSASPTGGFDCSGLAYYVFKHFGISIDRSSNGIANNGTAVSVSNLQIGDILLFKQHGASGRYDHTAIYIGGGKMIHAEPHSGVNIDVLMDNAYYENCFAKAVRVI